MTTLNVVDSVLAWVCTAALRLPVPTTARELAGCDGGPDASPPGSIVYTTARERVVRLDANKALLRWSVELQRVTVMRALIFQALVPVEDSVCPREALLVWTAMAPRQLLTAVPGVMEQLLEAVRRLTLISLWRHTVPLRKCPSRCPCRGTGGRTGGGRRRWQRGC